MIEKKLIEILINFYNHSFTIIDKDEKLIYWSVRASEIFNLKHEDVIGKDIKEVFSEDQLLILEALRRNRSFEKKRHQATPDIHVDIKAEPINIRGEVLGAVVSEVDVTSQIKKEKELMELKSKVDVLSDNVKHLHNDDPFKNIIYKSSIMENLKNQIEKAAKTNANILITGETGVGKELFAQAIHKTSRLEGDFIPLNCGAIPMELFESELFGYDGGAFTGANKGGNEGKIELAHDGTLFLDEIGEMPLEMQVKFLRILQERKYFKLGGKKEQTTNFRLISATNKRITELLSSDNFRSDLLYRINVINIHIPPLRERPDDIESLFYYYLFQLSDKYRKDLLYADQQLLKEIRAYEWPGNARELINVVERLVIFSNGSSLDNSIFHQYLEEVGSDRAMNIYSLPGGDIELKEYVDRVEADYIRRVLENHDHNIEKSSIALGVSRPTLYAKIKKFNL
ncbi:sigma-54 interaction domain-containing protein [Lacicoccus alkaliphilus]|uniref:PAS domain S-box-containing protein n=1 Tax=Lacicoccus alkaliphilus DSM 16010 TaxID=1123231 RepID=A0A1M7HVM1_9BACL|nr:histidine kinase N-terminal domain-containing protein [Salinicoccus alkaliphilus]SHM32562.1 PAS domain S-box-containing protein [Salinicoccus alkaliphilus DSM 16010]